MNDSQKTEIKNKLDDYCQGFPSQKKAVQQIKAVSEATIINIRKNKWQSITDEMWNKIAKEIGYNACKKWDTAETKNFHVLKALFDHAKDYQSSIAVIANSGTGKTETAEWYQRNNMNVVHIECDESMTVKDLLREILEDMGCDIMGSVYYLKKKIKSEVSKSSSFLIILDEIDKLKPPVFAVFITLANMLKNRSGFALLGTDVLQRKIERGLSANKTGFKEFFSRIARKFIALQGINKEDVCLVCQKNGLDDSNEIQKIFNECEGDLRRVRTSVIKHHRLNSKTA